MMVVIPLLFTSLPEWHHRVDRGVLILVVALFLVTILAHRYWRAVIRLEDELEAGRLDLQRSLERYRVAWRATPSPAAFVDRATGLVMVTTPGWVEAGLPAGGTELFGEDPELESAWRAIPPPDAQHRPAPPMTLEIRQRSFRCEPLADASLGVVLVILP